MHINTVMNRKHWVFDMDGTLTIAKHDFEAIRVELGLPSGIPIIEALDALPSVESAPLHKHLDDMELEVAQISEPAEGAAALLEYLLEQGTKIGILTRNNLPNIEVTLEAAGLLHYFREEDLLSRDCAAPKPAPDGIHKLLTGWSAGVDDAVMVGDYIHDLDAGINAGTATVYIDTSGAFPFEKSADVCVRQLSELTASST